MDIFTRMGGGEPDGKMMGQQTKGQTMWNLCLINTAGMQLKLRHGSYLFTHKENQLMWKWNWVLVNEWTFSCQEIGMIIYSQQLVGLNIKEKLQESTTASRGCLLACMRSTLTVKKKCVNLCSHKCTQKGRYWEYPEALGHNACMVF